MVYVSKRRGFRDFIKSRNNLIYIVIFLVFIVLLTVGLIIAKTQFIDNVNPDETTDIAQESTPDETETYVEAVGNYKLVIYPKSYCVQIYAFDEVTQAYEEKPIKSMICGIHPSITKTEGSVSAADTASRTIWAPFEEQYYRFQVAFDDKVVFHSALYDQQMDKNSLNADSYATIGQTSDVAGITLVIADAKWIYENCSFDSVYEISDEQPDASVQSEYSIIEIYEGYTFDPTEDSEQSPWCPIEITSFHYPESISIKGKTSQSELMKKAEILDAKGNSLNEYAVLAFEGYYNLNKVGEYTYTVTIADIYGHYYQQKSKVTLTNDGTMQEETTTVEETTVNESVEETTDIVTTEPTQQESTSESTVENTTEAPTTEEQTTETVPTVEETITESQEETTAEEEGQIQAEALE